MEALPRVFDICAAMPACSSEVRNRLVLAAEVCGLKGAVLLSHLKCSLRPKAAGSFVMRIGASWGLRSAIEELSSNKGRGPQY